MDKRKIGRIVESLKKALAEKAVDVDRIIVFGSQVKGTAGRDSDLDLIIVSHDFRGKNIFKRSDMISGVETKLTRKFLVPLDILMLAPEELNQPGSLLAQFAKSGRAFYAKAG